MSAPRHRAVACVNTLERRRLLAAPTVGIPYAAQASDTYVLNVTNTGGTTIAANTPLSGIETNFDSTLTLSSGVIISKASFGKFDISLPSGDASVRFMEWLHTARTLTTVRIDALTADGKVRESWISNNVFVATFEQTTAAGVLMDKVSFSITNIELQYHRYNASGTEITPVLQTQWDSLGNRGSTLSTPYASDYVATTPSVSEIVEFGSGQTPTTNSDFRFDLPVNTGGTGKPSAAEVTYSAVDGPDALFVLGNMFTGRVSNNVLYTKRNPATGLASQRYRLGQAYVTGYHISDTVGDNLPRTADYGLSAVQYQLQNFNYSGTSQTPSATAFGWDYSRNNTWNLGFNSANVVGPTSGSVNAPVDSVTFKFQSAVTFNTAWLKTEGLDSAALAASSGDGGFTWIVSNLASAQTADGPYAIKLLADKVNSLQGSGFTSALFSGSAGKSWTLDRSAPTLLSSAFDNDDVAPTPYSFDFKLSEPVSATATNDTVPILIRRKDTGALVVTANARVGADGVTLSANLGAVLADGRYTATLPAGSVRDAAGNLLASDQALPFFVLAGDANHDAIVNFADLVILAQNYNRTGLGFAKGNFDYSPDGKVDFDDLVILAQNYNRSLPALVPLKTADAGTSAIGRKSLAGELIL